jgi:hypothetical protein
MIYPSQIRAARGLLDVSQTELSKKAGVGFDKPNAVAPEKAR